MNKQRDTVREKILIFIFRWQIEKTRWPNRLLKISRLKDLKQKGIWANGGREGYLTDQCMPGVAFVIRHINIQ